MQKKIKQIIQTLLKVPDNIMKRMLVVKNPVTQRHYHGINQVLLSLACYEHEYTYPLFITYNQVKKHGGYVRKGEKGYPVVFWKQVEKEVEKEVDGEIIKEKVKFPVLRYYYVFNLDQCEIPEEIKLKWADTVDKGEGVPDLKDIDIIKKCEKIGVKLLPISQKVLPSYIPADDVIIYHEKNKDKQDLEFKCRMLQEMVTAVGVDLYGQRVLKDKLKARFLRNTASIMVFLYYKQRNRSIEKTKAYKEADDILDEILLKLKSEEMTGREFYRIIQDANAIAKIIITEKK